MNNINIPLPEIEAIQLIDVKSLRDCINQCKKNEISYPLRDFRLYSCGPYISECENRLNLAIASHQAAKSSKKRSETQFAVDKAENDLIHAVQTMKIQAEKQLSEQRLYIVDDEIRHPIGTLTRNLQVRVTFRWRESETDDWKIGSITVTHTTRPDLRHNQPVKRNRIKAEQDNQNDLYCTWEYLASLTKCAVREHFREGKPGSLIPNRFEAVPDNHSGELNNYSVNF
ncbi:MULTISPECIES: hypothetical protein [Pectobacterium]|uniref:hypothetical protein n=1 Tax=Pectobacterium TaxID=122277 RepID=UPI0001B0E100|nr:MULTISPECIES: hypothetical protein [Pectobacterium]ACX87393.1 hypothetical protein Pecwa_1603 [Pectobacterium parmentieri WPP163]QPI43555.1 hypothetical protein I2D83_02675 [Pectobacterium aroidearum]